MEDSPETTASRLLVVLCLVFAAVASTVEAADPSTLQEVTYDGRSLIINGKRELFFSGSIHYPRSPPEMWPDLIRKAKSGGLNMIDTYVFWNAHEPEFGKFNYEGRNDLVKFIKLVHEHGMYMILRLGPFIQGEWNFGGLPYWLKEVPKILFRSYNQPYMDHMERYMKMMVEKLKEEKLLLSQGGPIALLQVENEYNNIIGGSYRGADYIEWAGNMALGLGVDVPWVMCKQEKPPGSIIDTCNGRHCADTYTGPSSRSKPFLWTENWTAQYRSFGDPPSQRSAEDLAYAVGRFFARGGTLVNYYMYYGGTNFGRTAGEFVQTRYYDEAPLDEYGLLKEPKHGHLKDLHAAVRLCRKGLLWGNPSLLSLDKDLEAKVFESSDNSTCVAFISNRKLDTNATVNFRGRDFFLPRRSVSILPDCKTVVMNTEMVLAQHNFRTYEVSEVTSNNNQWKMFQEEIPSITSTDILSKGLLELFNMTKDTTDYLWYTTSLKLDAEDLPFRSNIRPVMEVATLSHGFLVFINDQYSGVAHGGKTKPDATHEMPVDLKAGVNKISILAWTFGMPDSGSIMDRKYAGLSVVSIKGLSAGTVDLSELSLWKYEVGLNGEKMGIFQESNLGAVNWVDAKSGTPITWYYRYFETPPGDDPIALNMSSMRKGMVYINGESIGRHWPACLDGLGMSSQPYYHVPRPFLKEKDNLMVVFEEQGGTPEDITIMLVSRDNICTVVADYYPAKVRIWSRENNQIRSSIADAKPEAHLDCGKNKVISSVVFASYGNPEGPCGSFAFGSCHAENTKSVVEDLCVGKTSCVLPVSPDVYGADPNCPYTKNLLSVQVQCVKKAIF